MGIANKKSLYQSPADRRIQQWLSQSDVDEERAREYVARVCAEIQSTWTAQKEKERRRWSLGQFVECRVFEVERRGEQVSYVET